MCIIISTLKHIHVQLIAALLPINPVNNIQKLRWGTCFFSCENFIAHPSLWGMFLRKYFERKCILERFDVYFNVILSLKCSLLTLMIVQLGG